ncbi:MAG: proton-conducting transporter membrane subunit [Fuerstiella sp.]
MQAVFGQLSCLPLLVMLSAACLPNRLVNRHAVAFRRGVTGLAALNTAAAVLMLLLTQLPGAEPLTIGPMPLISLSFYLNGAAALMLTLVAGAGWLICRYSIRYLDGEPHQGRYFRWTTFTIGAVSLAVMTSNLLILAAALLCTSLGLHQLLVHYADRPAAHRAAAMKFLFSRLGDIGLLTAAIALYREFGTFELPEIFAAVGGLTPSQLADSTAVLVAGWALVLCAIFKSAQFPFHTWLPETMEAPTPVSALMHAGIVNAGGYLLIRMMPIVSLQPSALMFVAGIGTLTAVTAALAMLSQTSIKRKLAWSTIAQMGFMMLQCGLGAFSAAMLHIVAHSLYKAHAFLSSGSVVAERAGMTAAPVAPSGRRSHVAAFLLSTATTFGLFSVLATVAGISVTTKPGGLILGFLLCLGIIHWMSRMFLTGRVFALTGVSIAAVLLAAYFTTFLMVDHIVKPSPVASSAADVLTTTGFLLVVAAAFSGLFVMEVMGARARSSKFLQQLYVHSSNGFYVDAFWRNIGRSFHS